MWVREKETTNFVKKKVAVAVKYQIAAKTHGEIMGFEPTSAKSSDIVLHDNESFRPQKLNIKIKE